MPHQIGLRYPLVRAAQMAQNGFFHDFTPDFQENARKPSKTNMIFGISDPKLPKTEVFINVFCKKLSFVTACNQTNHEKSFKQKNALQVILLIYVITISVDFPSFHLFI